MKSGCSAMVALAALAMLSAAVSAEEIRCQRVDVGVEPRNHGMVEFKNQGKPTLKGGFYFVKGGLTYRLNVEQMQTVNSINTTEVTLRDKSCGELKLQYRVVGQNKTAQVESAELLLKQSNGDLVFDCKVRSPERYFSAGKETGEMFVECVNDNETLSKTTLIVNRFYIASNTAI